MLYACVYKHEKIVDLLVEKGATVIVRDDRLSYQLCQSASEGDLTLIKLFAKSEADLNVKNFDGRTVGHIAVASNKIEIIEFLAKSKKYNFQTKDRWGKSPIDLIKWSDQISISEKNRLLSLISN